MRKVLILAALALTASLSACADTYAVRTEPPQGYYFGYYDGFSDGFYYPEYYSYYYSPHYYPYRYHAYFEPDRRGYLRGSLGAGGEHGVRNQGGRVYGRAAGSNGGARHGGSRGRGGGGGRR